MKNMKKQKKQQRKKEMREMVNSLLEQRGHLREIGGYIVHKPGRGKDIGLLFRGWDSDGETYVFGHDNGMIFPQIKIADELRKDLGDGWCVTDIATVTNNQFVTMHLEAILFDGADSPVERRWHVTQVVD